MSTNGLPASNDTNANSFADPKVFYDNWIDHHKGTIIFAAIVLFIGIIMFFQVCGAAASQSDPIGIAGSSAAGSNNDGDTDQLNPYAVGMFELLALIFILIGGGLWLYFGALNSKSKKLIEVQDYFGAVRINGRKDKDKEFNNDIIKYQTLVFEEKALAAGIPPADINPAKLIKKPPQEETVVKKKKPKKKEEPESEEESEESEDEESDEDSD